MRLDISPVNSELQKALRNIRAYDGKSRLRLEAALQSGVKAIQKGAQNRVRQRSGRLKKSIFSRLQRNTMTGYVGAKAPHAHLQEFGAKATRVDMKRVAGKRAKAMRFRLPGVNYYVFSHAVDIPRRMARPFMQPAFESARPGIVKSFADAVKPDGARA